MLLLLIAATTGEAAIHGKHAAQARTRALRRPAPETEAAQRCVL